MFGAQQILGPSPQGNFGSAQVVGPSPMQVAGPAAFIPMQAPAGFDMSGMMNMIMMIMMMRMITPMIAPAKERPREVEGRRG